MPPANFTGESPFCVSFGQSFTTSLRFHHRWILHPKRDIKNNLCKEFRDKFISQKFLNLARPLFFYLLSERYGKHRLPKILRFADDGADIKD